MALSMSLLIFGGYLFRTDVVQICYSRHILNSRPRKCLGFRSPLEALSLHFGVALTH